ncbi:MAG: hypothetical protein ACLR6J_10130 [Parabacteroides merdae]
MAVNSSGPPKQQRLKAIRNKPTNFPLDIELKRLDRSASRQVEIKEVYAEIIVRFQQYAFDKSKQWQRNQPELKQQPLFL